MDTIHSFKGYGKVDPFQEAAFKRKSRKRIVISISLFLLVVLTVRIIAGVAVHSKNKNGSGEIPATAISPTASIKSICSLTLYPNSCLITLDLANTSDTFNIFRLSLTVAMASLEKLSSFPATYMNRTNEPLVKGALIVCSGMVNDAVESITDCISAVDGEKLGSIIDDLKTWLSTIISDGETCLDGLREANAIFTDEIALLMEYPMQLASNSLAIISKLLPRVGNFEFPINRRRRLAAEAESGGFPSWLSVFDRRMLQEIPPPQPNVTVAKDGSGDVMTINEAVERIPLNSTTRVVIYVKAGEYVENVVLNKSYWNVMMYGDGKTATIISGSKNFVDGAVTFDTATVGVAGKGFIARDIAFKNTAEAAKHQAVAFRSGSDLSVLYRCSFDAFQDTLYAHSNRQFYRECDITGTIDFIFGYSSVVFQNCTILPRQPLPNQFVTITAQGNKNPDQNGATLIQRCVISALDNLTAPTYLGRLWKNYSTTVVMQSEIGGFLNPMGWISWVSGRDPPSTIFYGENANTGPGASITNRVKWSGYKGKLTADQVAKFNVKTLIQGPEWLPGTGVDFDTTKRNGMELSKIVL